GQALPVHVLKNTSSNVLQMCKLLHFYDLMGLNFLLPISRLHIPNVSSGLRLCRGCGLLTAHHRLLTQAAIQRVKYLCLMPLQRVPHCVLSMLYQIHLSFNDLLVLFFNTLYDTRHFYCRYSRFRAFVAYFRASTIDCLLDVLSSYNAKYNGYAC